MKKFLKIFLIIAMICLITVTLTGCGDEEETTSSKKSSKKAKTEDVEKYEEEDEDEEEEEEEVEENSKDISIGEWKGNTYTNDFIDLTFKMPSTWKKATDEEVANTMEIGTSIANIDKEELAKQAESSGLYCMMASDSTTGANVSILIQKMPISLTAELYLSSLASQLESITSINYEVGDSYKTTIGTKKYTAVDAEASVSGITMGQSYFVRTVDNYIVCIIITTTQDGQLEEIIDCFE